jgi:hypothetical protein
MPPSKSWKSSPLAEKRKVVISTTVRTLQRATYPAYPSLTNTAGVPGGKKKNTKTPTTGA